MASRFASVGKQAATDWRRAARELRPPCEALSKQKLGQRRYNSLSRPGNSVERAWRDLRGNGLGGSSPESVLMGLMAANGAVFALWHLPLLSHTFMYRHFTLTASDFWHGRALNILTCTFSHNDFWHLAWNLMGLYTFGGPVANLLGSTRFLSLYLLGGVCGSLAHVMLNSPPSRGAWQQLPGRLWREPRVLGASGGVMTLTALYICFFPQNIILVMGLIPTPGWLFGGLYMLGELQGLGNQHRSGIAHEAHLGGAAVGIAFYAAIRMLGRFPF